MKRHFIKTIRNVIIILLIPVLVNAQDSPVLLNWLSGDAPKISAGVSWGVPWPQGTIKKGQSFKLTASDNKNLPLQSWPLAYWPDGSLKWIGFATVAGSENGNLKLSLGETGSVSGTNKFIVKESSSGVTINTDKLHCFVPASGSFILDSLIVENRLVGSKGRLECVLQNGPGDGLYESPLKARYYSNINKVTVEQSGPVRVVVRVQGSMRTEKSQRSFLPFDIRMYFYSGSASVRLVNTIIYDGDDQKDFIKGLAIVFSVPMREELQNRHVRFSGETPGVWGEPVRVLVGSTGTIDGKRIFTEQVAGKTVPNQDQFPARAKELISDLPVWNDFKLIQNNADGFTIHKRTNTNSAWIDAIAGRRSTGLVFVGDVNGGLSVGLKDFWQSYPAALEINNAAKEVADLKIWLWSPNAEAMDMRHYDTVSHGLAATYEDVQKGLSTPYGVARTSELILFVNANVPSNEELNNQANMGTQTPLLVTTPEYLHSINLFGVWSLPDRSTPGKIWIENQLDDAISLYKKEIDQRNWYGFWNYGDVMHAYDPVRHTWSYDVGGYAWDNTELGSDFWLWYSFIRSGRADIFKMAEAMTRHTSEVDVYHIGELAGLGSRHNVRHWGCGSKEVRESQSASRRFYYYLTTDERTGDIMQQVAETADKSMAKLDPLRLILPKTQYPTHARIGPDWLALVGNWMTEWERTGDNKWRDKILTGVNSFAKMPYGFFSGQQGAFGYDPATNEMYKLNDEIGYIHLSALMGGPEVAFELTGLIKNKKFDKLWMQYCTLWGSSQEEIKKAFGKSAVVGVANNHWYARLPAYAYSINKDNLLADRAWNWFLNSRTNSQFETKTISGTDVLKTIEEAPGVSTNNTAQWCLNAIELLELAGDKMPEQNPLWNTGNNLKK